MTGTVLKRKTAGIIVQKYGGSSVASVDMLKRVARKIVETRERGHGVVVVISAMGDQTNELLNLARAVSATPSRRELDMLLSVGERIAMSILSMAINDLGHQAISFTGSQSGIITDTSHTRARIVEVRARRIIEELERGKIVIVAGYQGVSREKEITTLGRGGSDTTSIALAAALDADRCEIYSDVDGVCTADPRTVEDARRIDRLSYDELLDLSRAGAVVMKSQAVEYAKRHGIRIELRSTFRGGPGTTVGPEPAPGERPILGLSFDSELICFWGGETVEPASIRAELVPGLGELGFVPLCVNRVCPAPGRAGHLFMVFRKDGVTRPEEAIEAIVSGPSPAAGLLRPCGSVTVVTRDGQAVDALHGSAVDLLRGEGVDLIGYHLSDRCFMVFLPAAAARSAVRTLHRGLVAS
jgi:aspartate kinase